MNNLSEALKAGESGGGLLAASRANIEAFLAADPSEPERASIQELVEGENWEELNNRFFRTLAFGTGGVQLEGLPAPLRAALLMQVP